MNLPAVFGNKKSQQGITFIELIVVIAIFSSLSMLSTVFYTRFYMQNTVSNTTDRLVSSIRKAQVYSMSSKRNDQWSINYSGNTIILFKGNNFDLRNTAYDEDYAIGPNISITGLTTLSFAKGTGVPTSSSATITISSSGTTRVITLNSLGVISR